MKTLQAGRLENDAFQTAINASKDAAYVRGVKRLCVGSGEPEGRIQVQDSGRSFLETKWESEVARKRRKFCVMTAREFCPELTVVAGKLPDAPFDIYDENSQNTDKDTASQSVGPSNEAGENDILHDSEDTKRELMSSTGSPTPIGSLRSPAKMTAVHDAMHIDSLNSPVSDAKGVGMCETRPTDQEQCAVINSASDEVNSTTTAVHELTHEQEGKLVRSALRSSLDGEDAELLNDFLSRAKAKRAAKAALTNSQAADEAENSLSPEESPEDSTPRSRRVLEELNTNSPSPVKIQASPSKGESDPGEEVQEIPSKDIQDDEPAPASPACRRSTRVKAPPADAPAVRNTISLRRAKGTEFVFLQRTEAQELALATKRNTRKNRGNSVFPKYALQAMAEQGSENPIDKPEQLDYHGASNRRSAAVPKHVSWKEERLVEYEDDESLTPDEPEIGEDASKKSDVDHASSTRSGSKRPEKKAAVSSSTRSRSQMLQKADPEGGPSTSRSASTTTATPRSRRARRLGDSTTGVSGTPVKTGSGRISKPPASSAPMVAAAAAAGPSTPTKGRRKLIPKSPSSSLLPPPSSKSESSFVSGIPTRSAATAGSSEGTKRKSVIQASAGCTPMPRRVRARS